MINWHNETRKISELVPAKYNPRKISDSQRSDLKRSLSKFSVADPIIINKNNVIIGGHQRLKILLENGQDEVDVRVPDRELDDLEERELNLRLNKNLGDWDESLLRDFAPEMLIEVGFDTQFVDDLMNVEVIEDDFDADAEVNSLAQAETKVGDIYILGNHRLTCGDSTDLDVFHRLLDGAKADLIYTDPPYNVNYKSDSQGSIQNDNKDEKQFDEFLRAVFTNCFVNAHIHASLYSWFAMSNYNFFRAGGEKSGWKYLQTILWLKERFVLALGWYFQRVYEPCMIFYQDWDKRFINYKYSKESDVWDCDRLGFEERMDVWFQNRDKSKDYQHPTQKPVRLAERALRKSSEAGSVVLDPFAGSGSTMMCCEQLGRRCYSIEIDPKFCDVIVKRWETFTGKKAERVNVDLANLPNV